MTTRLGLPGRLGACLFDLDGVLTDTARIHAAAWKQMFDDFLTARARAGGAPFVAFDAGTDYDTYVDGKPRMQGVGSFLRSRGIEIPLGAPNDPPGTVTAHGLGNAKNDLVLRRIRADGVRAFPGSVRYLQAARAAGLRRAVVSASVNCAEVLAAAGLTDLFDVRIDGVTAATDRLAGKPAPDTYLAAARALDVEPGRAAVFEDALAGVEAGHAGGFGYVIGVDRGGQAAALRAHGADVVVDDLADLLQPA